MGLENIGSNSTPDALNPDWPIGATDGTMFGAIHLRNVKTTMKNFYNQFNSFVSWFSARLDPDEAVKKVLAAEDTEKLTGLDASHFLDAANLESPDPNQADLLPNDKFSVASLTELGLTQLLTGTTSASELQAATVKSLENLIVDVEGNVRNAAEIQWQSIAINNGSSTIVDLPSVLLGYISLGIPVELRFMQRVNRGEDLPSGGHGPDGNWGDKGFFSQVVTLRPEYWDSSDPSNSRRSGRIACKDRNSASTPPDNHYYYIYMGKQSDDTSFNLYNTLYTGGGGSVIQAAFRPQPELETA